MLSWGGVMVVCPVSLIGAVSPGRPYGPADFSSSGLSASSSSLEACWEGSVEGPAEAAAESWDKDVGPREKEETI